MAACGLRPLETFFKLDTDGDGLLDRFEFEAALQLMRHPYLEPLELDIAFAALDADGDGRFGIQTTFLFFHI